MIEKHLEVTSYKLRKYIIRNMQILSILKVKVTQQKSDTTEKSINHPATTNECDWFKPLSAKKSNGFHVAVLFVAVWTFTLKHH